MANDLLIKINADAANAKKEFDNIRKKTEDLEDTLNKVAIVSGVAFAALTAEIYLSTKAFEDAEKSGVQLTNALQNQGIYTKELTQDYDKFAKVVQAKTGIDDDAIKKAQAIATTFLGQTKITQELTSSIADLGAFMGGDLNGAAEKIARTISTGTNAFARQGLVISESATESERYAQVLEFVRTKAGGLAEELNKADGFSQALATSFGNFQEAIGSRFAPIVAAIRKSFIAFFDYLSNSPALTDFIVALISGAAAVTGIIAAIAAAVPVFLALSAAATALGVSLNVAFLGIPLIIGAVIAAVTLLALNWDKSMASIKAVSTGVVSFLSELFGGLGSILSGAFNLDINQVKAGLAQVKGAFAKAKDDTVATYQEIREAQAEEDEKQNADKKVAADKAAAIERQHQANLRAIKKAETDLLRLQTENASAEIIELKTKEIAVLKSLDEQKSAQEIALYQQQREQIKALQVQAQEEDLQEIAAFEQLRQETEAELNAQGIQITAELRAQELTDLRAHLLTEAEAERQIQTDILKSKTDARNKELLDRKKYGETVAKLNTILGSEEVKGVQAASAELVALQQSKNQTLKTIGKAAAISQITISTAQAAMDIYKGFATIPIVGPALGVAGAAAAVAFGAERIGQVTAAADGGLIEGGISGRDSVPALLMPGELVVPKKNFNDVVGNIQSGGEGGNMSEVLNELKQINEKFSNPQNFTFTGDLIADESYIDRITSKISDAIEFRNARFFGVTA